MTSSQALPGRETPRTTAFKAADQLHAARGHERAGCVSEAMNCYRKAIEEAGRSSAWAVEAEAFRRLAVLHHNRGEPDAATDSCSKSLEIAARTGDSALAAEALNVQALFALHRGDLATARGTFDRALALGGQFPELHARIEGNLGVLANVRGDLDSAIGHYSRSLDAYQQAGHEEGCARAYHNLGMISADREQWVEADRYFEHSHQIAEKIGDLHLQGLCLLNHSEVHVARQQFDLAKSSAEQALAIFDQLGSQLDKPDVYRVIGTVYRETGRPALAESRLRSAIDLSATTGSVLSQAEASRELALLYQNDGTQPGSAVAAEHGARPVRPARRPGGRWWTSAARSPSSRRRSSRWCATGASRSNRRTPTPSVTASAWPGTPRAWRGRWGSMFTRSPPCASAPTSTTSARSACRTKCSTSRAA